MSVPFTETLQKIPRTGSRDPDTRRWSVTDGDPVGFEANVAVASGDDLELLPEGEVTGHEIKLITEHELSVSDEDSGPPEFADHVLYDGDRYKVMNVETYSQVIPHYEVVCTKV